MERLEGDNKYHAEHYGLQVCYSLCNVPSGQLLHNDKMLFNWIDLGRFVEELWSDLSLFEEVLVQFATQI